MCCWQLGNNPELLCWPFLCLQDNFEVMNDSLDILVDVLGKFGHLLPEQHATIVAVLLPHLDDHRQGIRKRALHCIGEQPRQARCWLAPELGAVLTPA